MIKDNLEEIYSKLNNCSLIGVTKHRTVEEINNFLKFSKEKVIGENYVKDYHDKKEQLDSHTAHLIGKLQSNKVKTAVNLFDVIQTVDSLKLASKINQEATKINKIQKIMIQVNISDDSNKSGCSTAEADSLIKEILALKNIKLIGLMTILIDTEDKTEIYNYYCEMYKLAQKIKELYKLDILLSMGMSGDYELAVKAKSDFVRIGTAIFGERL